jgi:dTDP-4-dehydrorhamnose reductase
VAAEEGILQNNEDALVVRTSSFFGPWDAHNFVTTTLAKLRDDVQVVASDDVIVSPTYVPDLVHACLDLLIDGGRGIFHVTNGEALSWAELATRVALSANYSPSMITHMPQESMSWEAKRPNYSALVSERGITMPTLDDALERFFEAQENGYHSGKMAG